MSKQDQMNEWLEQMAADSGKKIKDSAVMMTLITKNCLESPEMIFQIGCAVMMDKPIMLMVDKDTPIPNHLQKIATAIERVDTSNKSDMDRAAETIRLMISNIDIKHDGEKDGLS